MHASGAPDADRWAALTPKCGCRTVAHRSPWMGIEARENRRSTSPVPHTGRVQTNARRAWCPSCMVHPNARRAWCPSCRRRVPCMGESRSWPVVRGESRAWASPGHGPSSAMPRPNMACSRRRYRRCTNMYSFTPPWRSIEARSAARLRRVVGPPSPQPVDAEPSGQSERSRITTYHWG